MHSRIQNVASLLLALAIALLLSPVPLAAQPAAVTISRSSGIYGAMDANIDEVRRMDVKTELGGWRLTATVVDLVDNIERSDQLAIWSNGANSRSVLDEVKLSATRYEALSPNTWLSFSAEMNAVTPLDYRDYMNRDGSVSVGLSHLSGSTLYWFSQERQFNSSYAYTARDTWETSAGVAVDSGQESWGVMASKTQYAFASWGSATSLTFYTERPSRLGQFRLWIVGQEQSGKLGVTAAVMVSKRF
jgi:hypothetical protein